MAPLVRAIASRELNAANALRIIGRELIVGVLNGAAIGLMLGGGLFVWQHDFKLSLVVFLAIIANLFVAALGGILAPIVLGALSHQQRNAGLDANGLPLGLQLIGRPFEEETLFALASVIERAAGAFRPEPWWSASAQ